MTISWFCLQVYAYEALVVTHRGRCKLPPGVDRTRLEVGTTDVFIQNTVILKTINSQNLLLCTF